MAKKSTSEHLLNNQKSPLDYSFKQSCNFEIYDIKMEFGNYSISMWNVRMGKEKFYAGNQELSQLSQFGSN